MTTNEIYNQIELETQACVERRYSFWKFKPRRHYEPKCRAEAKANYQSQIAQEVNESEAITDAVQARILAADNTIVITLVVGLILIFITYFLIFK